MQTRYITFDVDTDREMIDCNRYDYPKNEEIGFILYRFQACNNYFFFYFVELNRQHEQFDRILNFLLLFNLLNYHTIISFAG